MPRCVEPRGWIFRRGDPPGAGPRQRSCRGRQRGSSATRASIQRSLDLRESSDTHGRNIAAPTFVANGDRDELFPAIDSAVLAREIPHSQLGIYPDSGHAFLFQYPERFANDVSRFLAGDR